MLSLTSPMTTVSVLVPLTGGLPLSLMITAMSHCVSVSLSVCLSSLCGTSNTVDHRDVELFALFAVERA